MPPPKKLKATLKAKAKPLKAARRELAVQLHKCLLQRFIDDEDALNEYVYGILEVTPKFLEQKDNDIDQVAEMILPSLPEDDIDVAKHAVELIRSFIDQYGSMDDDWFQRVPIPEKSTGSGSISVSERFAPMAPEDSSKTYTHIFSTKEQAREYVEKRLQLVLDAFPIFEHTSGFNRDNGTVTITDDYVEVTVDDDIEFTSEHGKYSWEIN